MKPTRVLEGSLLSVYDYRFRVKPADTPFTDVHNHFSISYVRRGGFTYNTLGREYDLVAGASLIGQPDQEYSCSHADRWGDECLVFCLQPALLEVVGADNPLWNAGALPPLPELMIYGEMAQAAADGHNDIGLEEAGVLFTTGFARMVSGREREALNISSLDRRRALDAAMWIDANCQDAINLESAAKNAGYSPFHFLRMFARVIGVTPHQYLIRSRLRRAARLLADGGQSVTAVAYDVGFGDLSNFVRTFTKAAGATPGAFRRAARGERNIFQARLDLVALA